MAQPTRIRGSREDEIAAILENAIRGLNKVAEAVSIALLPEMLAFPSSGENQIEGISIKHVAYWKVTGNIQTMEDLEVHVELVNGRILKIREPKESAAAVASYLIATGMPEEEGEDR